MSNKCKDIIFELHYGKTDEPNTLEDIIDNLYSVFYYKNSEYIFGLMDNQKYIISAYSMEGVLYKVNNGLYKLPPEICKELRGKLTTNIPKRMICSLWLTMTKICEEEIDTLLMPTLKQNNINTLEDTLKYTKDVIGYDDFDRFVKECKIGWTRVEPFPHRDTDIYDPIKK